MFVLIRIPNEDCNGLCGKYRRDGVNTRLGWSACVNEYIFLIRYGIPVFHSWLKRAPMMKLYNLCLSPKCKNYPRLNSGCC